MAKLTTVRTLLAVAATQNWMTVQMDISNAFLHGELEEIIYMKMPQGYNGWGSRISAEYSANSSILNLVCKLLKSLYGLRQAPRQWFNKLSETVLQLGYVQSRTDYSLFTKCSGDFITLVLIYVDDLLIAGNSADEINHLKIMLSKQFHMKDLGPVNYFLGLEVSRSSLGFFVSQKKYTLDLLHEFGMDAVTPLKLAMDSHLKLIPTTGSPIVDPHPYQRLVGKLIYLTVTRPDITFVVHILSQFMHQPTSSHMQAAKRLLQYLVGNPSQGILLTSSLDMAIHAYSDIDWANCPVTRRSTSGFCLLLGKSPVSWKTKKQNVVARSTAEAEYRSMTMTACEITWLTSLLKDMGMNSLPPALLHCDNMAALSIAANPVMHERTKHVEIDCHFVRDKIKAGDIKTTHVPTQSQVADILTKPLSVKQHYLLLDKLGASSSA